MLIFGCITSILVVFFEYKTQTKKNEQEITNEDKEMSLIEEKMGKYLEGLSNRKTETILDRLKQKHIRNKEDTKTDMKRSDDFNLELVRVPKNCASKISRLITQRNSI